MSSGAAQVRSWAKGLKKFAGTWPEDAGQVLADTVEVRLHRDTGGDGAFSGGPSLGRAEVQVQAGDGFADVLGAGSPIIWRILEGGTGRRRPRRSRALRTPWGPRASVRGVGAKNTWTLGLAEGMVKVQAEAAKAWAEVAA